MRGLACVGAVTLAALGAGCTTTMQKAARLQLNSARIRASERSTRVTVTGGPLRVRRVALVSAHGSTAFVVAVQNTSPRQLSDVPISVGVHTGHRRRVYLNAQAGREDFYFDAHLPVIAPGRTLTWVYTTRRRLPAAAAPFAIVGRRPEPPAPAVGDLPVIRATVLSSTPRPPQGRPARTRLRVALDNLSTVPQYQLQVYAVARSGRSYRAAASGTVTELDGQAHATVDLGLVGRYQPGQLQVKALPTTLQ